MCVSDEVVLEQENKASTKLAYSNSTVSCSYHGVYVS